MPIGFIQPFELGARLGSYDPLFCNKLEVRQVCFTNLYETISREEHQTIKCGLRISGMALSNQSDSQALQVNVKIPMNSGLWQAAIARPLLRFSNLTWRWHQIRVIYVPGPSQFRLVVGRDLANLSYASSGIWPFSESYLPGLGQPRQVIFPNSWLGRMWWLIFKLTCRGLNNAGNSLWLDKAPSNP